MPPPKLTSAQWLEARQRALVRGLELTKSGPKARELRDAAIIKALEPETTPWDPAGKKTFADYLCDLVWSLHGNESKSYRIQKASHRLDDAADASAPSSERPDQLALSSPEKARAERLNAALQRRIEGDALILLLLERDGDDAALATSSDSPGNEMSADDPPDEPAPKKDPKMNAEAASTRRALAKGYTEKDIKNARERLKRHAIVVAREDAEVKP
jgi:hypothetical protein